uniref:Uncharacterized protein n=1 Tax=Anopheles culicifacies TaxID=139723 RepID=A0A182MJN2_9DIPT
MDYRCRTVVVGSADVRRTRNNNLNLQLAHWGFALYARILRSPSEHPESIGVLCSLSEHPESIGVLRSQSEQPESIGVLRSGWSSGVGSGVLSESESLVAVSCYICGRVVYGASPSEWLPDC